MKESECVFCRIVAGELPCCKIHEDERTLAFLDIAPFVKGHVLVIPKLHAERLIDLPEAETAALSLAVRKVARQVVERLQCEGFNLLQNNGACASQVVPHVHTHIVPRWRGDEINWDVPLKYDSMEEMLAMCKRLSGE